MNKNKVLILTAKDEVAIPRVEYFLRKMGQHYFRLDTDKLLDNSAKLTLALNERQLTGQITLMDRYNLNFESIKSIWFRRPKPISIKKFKNDIRTSQFIEKEFSATLYSLYTNLEDVFWMNHPLYSRNIIEHNKLLQLKLASLSGFLIPHTIITNNQPELLDFCIKNGGTIAIKPLHTSIFREIDNSTTAIYTNKVTLDFINNKSNSISLAPLIAQEYIEKEFELRLTVVGKRILSCAIYSQDSERTSIDWRRYDFNNVKHEKYELPAGVSLKIHNFMNRCGLAFGAIDMIVTPDGKYVFLEVNQSGQFGWIEELTKLPISESIAEALVTCE